MFHELIGLGEDFNQDFEITRLKGKVTMFFVKNGKDTIPDCSEVH